MHDSLTLNQNGDPELNESLSPRERQLLVMATNGLTDHGIAHDLGISLATVSTYWGRVRIKFGPLPRTELVAKYIRGEMMRAIAALSASEARFRSLLESSPMGITLTDAEGKLAYANPAYEAITGRSLDELLQMDPRDFLHPEDRARVSEIWARCIVQETPYTSEHRYRRDDGSTVWVHARGNIWRHEGVSGRVNVIEDVTATYAAEHARIDAERRYRSLLALAPEAIISLGEDLRIVEFNPGAERTFGYVADEVVGRPLSILLPQAFAGSPDGDVWSFAEGASIAARPTATRVEISGRRKDGEEFPCEASILRESFGGRSLYTAILRDVSQRFPGEEACEIALI